MKILKTILSLISATRKFRARYGTVGLCSKIASVIQLAIKDGGLGNFQQKMLGISLRYSDPLDYHDWIRLNERISNKEYKAQSLELIHRPRFSILVPTYNTPAEILSAFIQSVLDQSYPEWELCIADDASSAGHVRQMLDHYAANDKRIKIVYRRTNGHISEATNSALEMATGDYICLMDHDDIIAPNALYEFAHLLNENPEFDFIYSDEDKITYDGKTRFLPFFKPDWSPEYLESCMYTAHFACYRTCIAKKIGGFRAGYEGAQDYDFVLRFTEHTCRVGHINKILYHWRAMPGSTAVSMENKKYVEDAAIRALYAHMERTGEPDFIKPTPSRACFHVRYKIANCPKVSIVIPSAGRNSIIRGNEVDLLVNCIHSIFQQSSYKNIEIIVVDNGDLRPDTLNSLKEFSIKFLHYENPVFNIATKMNMGAAASEGEYLLFLNDDIEIISEDWIEAMLSLAQRPGVGVVGPKLLFEDGKLQHVGIAFNNGLPDHIYREYPGNDPGYFFSSEAQRNYLAVTGACLMIGKNIFEEVGGFNANLAINYNDIDLCLKVYFDAGLRIVYSGQAKLYHFESKNRVRSVSREEIDLFHDLWGEKVRNDPFYSRYFSASPPEFRLAKLDYSDS